MYLRFSIIITRARLTGAFLIGVFVKINVKTGALYNNMAPAGSKLGSIGNLGRGVRKYENRRVIH